MSTGQVGRASQLLKDRGVSDSLLSEFASLPEQTVLTIITRFDADESASVGALVFRLRQAVKKQAEPAPSKQNLMAREAQYGKDVAAWIEAEMPELCRPKWGPHPAAVAALIRLDFVHGKTNRRKSTHGPVVRAAVKDWERKFGDDAEKAA